MCNSYERRCNTLHFLVVQGRIFVPAFRFCLKFRAGDATQLATPTMGPGCAHRAYRPYNPHICWKDEAVAQKERLLRTRRRTGTVGVRLETRKIGIKEIFQINFGQAGAAATKKLISDPGHGTKEYFERKDP